MKILRPRIDIQEVIIKKQISKAKTVTELLGDDKEKKVYNRLFIAKNTYAISISILK